MNKNRLIFFGVIGFYHLCLVIFTFYIDSNKSDLGFLVRLLEKMWLLKFGSVLGLLLILVDVIWSWIINRDSQKEKAALTHELNTLKAKLFDLQEAEKKSQAQQQTK